MTLGLQQSQGEQPQLNFQRPSQVTVDDNTMDTDTPIKSGIPIESPESEDEPAKSLASPKSLEEPEFDDDKVDPQVDLVRHDETGLYVCFHNHIATVVLKDQLANHLKKKHNGKDNKAVCTAIRKHINDSELNKVPACIDTPLPKIPVVQSDYCFNCARVFKNYKDHIEEYQCKRPQRHKVSCQFYLQNHGVIVGAIPQQNSMQQGFRSFLRSHEVS